jgi:hypothetical protein
MFELTYGALHDLSEVLEESPSIIGLGFDPKMLLTKSDEEKTNALRKNLAIALGSRGSGRANAHYEPMKNVINLTAKNGNGSLAHEWAHALDSKLAEHVDIEKSKEREELERRKDADEGKTDYVTPYGSKRSLSRLYFTHHPIEMYKKSNASEMLYNPIFTKGDSDGNFSIAWKDLTNAIHTSTFCNVSKEYDKKKSYWGDQKECFARAFESYVGDKTKNRFLALDTKATKGFWSKVYPQGEERKELYKKFDAIMNTKKLSSIIQS